MTPRIRRVADATPEEWDSLWRACSYATYFHSREWAEIWNRHSQGRVVPAALLLHFRDDARVLLPLCRVRRHGGLDPLSVSSAAGTYGGWISDSELQPAHVDAIVEFIQTRLGSHQVRLNPYAPQPTRALVGARQDSTHTLDLSVGFESVTRSWSKGHFSAARKGIREGVVARVAQTENDWRAYFAIYEDSVRRWGDKATSRYGWELFAGIYSMRSTHIKLWLAEFEGTLAAGALCLHAGANVVYWHGAALESLFHVRPVHALLWSVVEDACASGYRYFDFNPSGGHEGVKAFKRGFGTAELPCPLISGESRWSKFVDMTLRAGQMLGRLRGRGSSS